MDFKKLRKSLGRQAGWFGLVWSSLIIKVIPDSLVYLFADKIACLGYIFTVRQRKLALESLEIAFGREKSRAQREKIARESFYAVAKSAIEVMFLTDKPWLLKEKIQIAGREHLEAALSKGRGVILVSGHFGNFPLLLSRLSLEGYKTSGIMRPMHDRRVERMFLQKRQRYSVKTIYSEPRNTCVNQTIEALRRNELVFIPIDQNFGSAGVFVNFFGQKAATATGPVVFAQRTKAALLPCFIIRQNDDTHKLVFEAALELKEGRDARETIAINIQKLTDIIESYIRKYPAQWGWMHRRWKSKPSNQAIMNEGGV